jgi:SAM-dependent methyltransferase
MNARLRASWNAFSSDYARQYLKTRGAPSLGSKALLADILEKMPQPVRIVDLGCGNGQLYDYFKERGLNCRYTGIDFSEPLLAAARAKHQEDPSARFVIGDIEELDFDERFDVALYSHVLEMVESPERTLRQAASLAPTVLIRFFEPPHDTPDVVELLQMEVGDGRTVPYLRRTMSLDYYRLLLARIGASAVDVYEDPSGAKDEVHVVHIG